MIIFNNIQEEFRDNVDPRRRQERVDARLVQENHQECANLSQKTINRTWDAWKYPERIAMYDASSRKPGESW